MELINEKPESPIELLKKEMDILHEECTKTIENMNVFSREMKKTSELLKCTGNSFEAISKMG